MYLIHASIVFIGILTFALGVWLKKGIVWLVPLAFNGIAFYIGVVNSYPGIYFPVIGCLAIISLILCVIELVRGNLV